MKKIQNHPNYLTQGDTLNSLTAHFQPLFRDLETIENRAVEKSSKRNCPLSHRRIRKAFESRPTIYELLQEALTEKQRLTFTYQRKVFVAVVPIEQVNLIEDIQTGLQNRLPLDSLMNVTEIERSTNLPGHLPVLKELLQRVSITKETLMVTYQGILFIVMAPIADKVLREKIEDCMDRQAVADAHNRGDIPIPLEEAKKILGW